MGFLVPAFLAGALAIGIPVWVHLTNKQRKEAVEFPSLMFLEKIPFRSEQKQVIRNVLLFALRVLALILFITAFSRPFLGKVAKPVITGNAREVAIVLDRSYSMGFGERWTRAVAAANEAIEGLGSTDLATIIFFDDKAALSGDPTSDKATLKAVLSTAAVSDRPTRYVPALKLAQKTLEESELGHLEMLLISDFQKAGWAGHEEVLLPRGTAVKTVDVGEDSVANLAVTTVNLRRENQAGRDRFIASGRITNGGHEAKNGVVATLILNGRAVETRRVDVPARNAATVIFPAVAVPDAATKGAISITGDGLAVDDEFDFVISSDQEVGVLIIEDETPVLNQSFFLRGALNIGERPHFRVSVLPPSRLTFAELDRRALVILNDVPFPGGDMGRRLREFVNQGGGLLVVLGEQSNAANWSPDVQAMLPGRAGGIEKRNTGRGVALASLQYTHPIFEIFSAPRSGDFSGARFFTYTTVSPADSAKVVAHFDDGNIAIVEGSYGKGRVVMFAAPLDGSDVHSDLPRHVVFLPFIHEVAKHVASFSDARPWFNVGEVIDVVQHAQPSNAGVASRSTTADSLTAADLVLISPKGDPVVGATDQPSGFLELEHKGFYELRQAGARSTAIPVAVNVDLAESDLARFEPVEIVTSITSTGSETASAADERNLTETEREKRQNLWWYLLVLALLLLAGETLLGNRISPALRTRTS